MESELFGHEKGAFTGAVERRAGCFELAQHGTLLLDELAEMPVGTQAKLLRVLEDSRVRRLGGKTEIAVDVRVIASTNKVLEEALRKGELREDLYYRLNVFQIALPPLRQREGDLPLLTAALIEMLNHKHETRVVDVHPDVMEQFKRYSWPGNVRELRNVLERAVIIAGRRNHHAASSAARFRRSVRLARRPSRSWNRMPCGYRWAPRSVKPKRPSFRSRYSTPRTTRRAPPRSWVSASRRSSTSLKEYGAAEAEAGRVRKCLSKPGFESRSWRWSRWSSSRCRRFTCTTSRDSPSARLLIAPT